MRNAAPGVALVLGAALVAVGSCLPLATLVAPSQLRQTEAGFSFLSLGYVPLSVLGCAGGRPAETVQIHDTYLASGGSVAVWPARLVLVSLLASVGFVAARWRSAALVSSALLAASVGWLFVGTRASHAVSAAGWTAYPPLTSTPVLPSADSWGAWGALATGALLVVAAAWLRRADEPRPVSV